MMVWWSHHALKSGELHLHLAQLFRETEVKVAIFRLTWTGGTELSSIRRSNLQVAGRLQARRTESVCCNRNKSSGCCPWSARTVDDRLRQCISNLYEKRERFSGRT